MDEAKEYAKEYAKLWQSKIQANDRSMQEVREMWAGKLRAMGLDVS